MFLKLLRQRLVGSVRENSLVQQPGYCLNQAGEFYINQIRKLSSNNAKASRKTGKARRSELLTFRPINVALVGRPNVGKSTIFNALSIEKDRSSKAIVTDVPGTTRDRREAQGQLGSVKFKLIDTGGFEEPTMKNPNASIAGEHGPAMISDMLNQTRLGIMDSNVSFFVVDGKVGLTPDDFYFAKFIRQNCLSDDDSKIKLLVNKVDNPNQVPEELFDECHSLGFGEPIFISALQKSGLGDLYNALEEFALVEDPDEIEALKRQEEEESQKKRLKVALIGKPNVGKSTLINQIVGSNRVITGPIPGLTRDCISVQCTHDDYELTLFDTAGIKKKKNLATKKSFEYKMKLKSTTAKSHDYSYEDLINSQSNEEVAERIERELAKKLEQQSISDSMRALEICDVAIFVMDATAYENDFHALGPLNRQDFDILNRVFDAGKPVVIAANKAEKLLKNEGMMKQFLTSVENDFMRVLPGAKTTPVIGICATEGNEVNSLLEKAIDVYERSEQTVRTRKLNEWLKKILASHRPPAFGGVKKIPGRRQARLKIKFIAQVSTKPPTFALFTNRREVSSSTIPESYVRFLISSLREKFGFAGIPIRIKLKNSGEERPSRSG